LLLDGDRGEVHGENHDAVRGDVHHRMVMVCVLALGR
jgi:hypothetical protein